MKRILSLIFLIFICMSLCACGGSGNMQEAQDVPQLPGTETPEASVSDELDEPVVDELDVPVEPEFMLVEEHLSSAGKVYITAEQTIGRGDYVPCIIRIEDPSGNYETIEDPECTIKIRGNSTAEGAKAPYNIKFSSKTEVFGLGKDKKWCLLANMFDKTLMRNKLAYDFAQVIGVPYTSSSAFVDVYLNDEYLGNYLFCESVGTGSTQVDIDTELNEFLLELERSEGYENPQWITTDSNIILGFEDPEEPTEEQVEWIENFLHEAEAALIGGNYENVSLYYDLDSMVNDYLLHELFKNVDATYCSARYHIKDGKIYGGPAWDFDLSSGNVNKDYYTKYYASGESYEGWWCLGVWYDDLFKTDWFEDLARSRLIELQPAIENLTTDNELGQNRIDALIDIYGESFEANYSSEGAGWDVSSQDSTFEGDSRSTFEEHIADLRQWIIDRNEWMKEQWGIA